MLTGINKHRTLHSSNKLKGINRHCALYSSHRKQGKARQRNP